MKESTLYCEASKLSIAASMASTWVWAPALFVSSSIAYQYGILGLLVFLVPNILTILIFGKVAEYYTNKHKILVYTSIYNSEPEIKNMQFCIGTILLICSTCVQLIGMCVLIENWFNISRFYSCIGIILLGLFIVYNKGLRGVIYSDLWKYFILLAVGLILCFYSFDTQDVQTIFVKNPESNSYLISFGITTCIGLLAAPYVDQTFWNRVAVAAPKNVSKTFNLTAGMFLLIPLCFGSIGLFSASNGIDFSGSWNITQEMGKGIWGIILGIGVFCALLSTVDSNLCGFHGLMKSRTSDKNAGYLLIGFSIFVVMLVSTVNITITQLFLIYGTIRTAAFLPAILVIFDKYDSERLKIGMGLSLLLAITAYPLMTMYYPDYAYLISVLVLLVPLLGYRR